MTIKHPKANEVVKELEFMEKQSVGWQFFTDKKKKEFINYVKKKEKELDFDFMDELNLQ